MPAYLANSKVEVYYKLDDSLPRDLDSIVANTLIADKFNIVSPEIILIDKNIKANDINNMINEIKSLDGIDLVLSSSELSKLGLSPELLKSNEKSIFESENLQMIFLNSTYEIATNELNNQVDSINKIIDKYDKNAILAGEGPLMKDLVTISNQDFKMTNYSSIAVILIIMLIVLKSYTLPLLLILAIEFAIFVNLSIPYFSGETLPFVAQIVLGTIQLGATIDYAILMTTTYLNLRKDGIDKTSAIKETLNTSTSSILVSGLCFFAATFGVGVYSKLEMISSLCTLISRGALISMFVVIFILPSILLIFDKLICKTTLGFRKDKNMKNKNLKLALLILCIMLPIKTHALTKDETVYINLNNDGSLKESFVTEHLINNKKENQIKDISDLTDIYNTNGNETFIKDDYGLLWETNGNDIFYRGNTKKEIPIKIDIKYYLDNKEYSLNEILGKVGKIQIKIKFENIDKHYVSTLGKNMYTPFVTVLGTMIDAENNSNVKINNGKIINNGSKYMVIGLSTPGLYDSLKLDSLKSMDEIVITYETKKFELANIYSAITPKVLDEADLNVFNKLNNFYSGIKELQESIEKIEDGAKKLSDGASKLNDGTSKISENMAIVSEKLESIQSGTIAIDNGLKEILVKLNESITLLNSDNNINKMNEISALIAKNESVSSSLATSEVTAAYQNYKLNDLSVEQINGFTKETYASFGLNLSLEETIIMNKTLIDAKNAYELSLLLDTNSKVLKEILNTMNDTSSQINNMVSTLENYLSQIEQGANTLSNGTSELNAGVKTLSSKTKEISNGTSILNNGINELSEGITKFNEEGITKLTNISNEIEKKEIEVKELIKLGENYQTFTKKDSSAKGETKFIISIEGAKLKEEKNEEIKTKNKDNLWIKIKNLFK